MTTRNPIELILFLHMEELEPLVNAYFLRGCLLLGFGHVSLMLIETCYGFE